MTTIFIPIEELRVAIGLTSVDTTKDVELEAAEATMLGLIESYLDRKLQYISDEEIMIAGREAFLVHRWPVDQVGFSISDENGQIDIFPGQVDYKRGIIRFDGSGTFTVAYTGGFAILPPELYWACKVTFSALWAATPGWGATSGVIMGTGAVKKVSLVGIGSVDLDVGATASANTSSGASAIGPWGVIPASAVALLDRYRRESAVGVG